MSRIGKLPITVPSGVNLKISGSLVSVEGPRGSGSYELPPGISIESADGAFHLRRADDRRESRAFHGLARKLVANLVAGMSVGFAKTLEIVGVGYRAELKGRKLHLNLGYSHPIVYSLPEGVTAKVERPTVIHLESNDRQLLGEVAAQIRRLRPPEPYKGKGVRYAGEKIRRKAGKAAATGAR